MAIGTNAQTLSLVPGTDFVTDPVAFAAGTSRNVMTPLSGPVAEWGEPWRTQLPQVGIISMLRISFVGTLTVATAAATTAAAFPHGLLSNFSLSANGQQDLIQVNGPDLHALRTVNNPGYFMTPDTFDGQLAQGPAADTTVAVGAHAIMLTYDVPIAADQMSLTGALFAQSSATNLAIQLTTAAASDMFTAATAANVSIAGKWSVQTTTYEIPFDPTGKLILPDLSRLHGINGFDTAFMNTGDVPVSLIRSSGQLLRLFTSGQSDVNVPLDATDVDRLRLQYGGNKAPYDFNPAYFLQAENDAAYGGFGIAYGRYCLDLIRLYPSRDVLYLQGVTELQEIVTIATGTPVPAGKIHLVQETLY